jgi:hypothetical protein
MLSLEFYRRCPRRDQVQIGFVNDTSQAVRKADAPVAQGMNNLAQKPSRMTDRRRTQPERHRSAPAGDAAPLPVVLPASAVAVAGC